MLLELMKYVSFFQGTFLKYEGGNVLYRFMMYFINSQRSTFNILCLK